LIHAILGIAGLLAIAWLLSEKRAAVPWRAIANFRSLGIMIGGLGTMCPERRGEVVALGLKSIVAGTLATCLTAATVGLIV
jgi:nucleoside permease NupC